MEKVDVRGTPALPYHSLLGLSGVTRSAPVLTHKVPPVERSMCPVDHVMSKSLAGRLPALCLPLGQGGECDRR